MRVLSMLFCRFMLEFLTILIKQIHVLKKCEVVNTILILLEREWEEVETLILY